MSFTEEDSVRVIPGIGPVVAQALENLGIFKIADLLRWYPRLYIDGSRPVLASQAALERLVAVSITIDSLQVRPTKNRNLKIIDVKAHDEGGDLTVRWFNQPYLKQKLIPGSQWILIGTVQNTKGKFSMLSPLIEDTPSILAVYSQTQGITSKMLRVFIDFILKRISLNSGPLPHKVLTEEGLPDRITALRAIHQPTSMDESELGRRYLAFEEVFSFFVRMALGKKEKSGAPGIVMPVDLPFLQAVTASLPFTLTPGQKKAIWEAVQDMAAGQAMTRLLNGDVGSGKTVVAAVLAAQVAKAGWRTVILVPTEILAKQHLASISALLAPFNIKATLWTASQKEELTESQVIIGTHAVLQEGFKVDKLGLVVIDEQHRFGVKQRQFLRESSQKLPHLLSMTATPIPRTLALVLYGDLTVSVLPDKPQGRLPIITQTILPRQRASMHQRILFELQAGHQVFVICPLIEEKPKKEPEAEEGELTLFTNIEGTPEQQSKTVLREMERLRTEHPEYGVIEAVHGKMKSEQKRTIMDAMGRGDINVLVATSVIEVGVDVPGATVMIIEGAERFGLAQLHQFRGRVGRNSYQSYCFLVPAIPSHNVLQRLEILEQEDSGFTVAEKDLALRGPGEMIGSVQSGLPDFRMATLTDLVFLQHVRDVVQKCSEKDLHFLENFSDANYAIVGGSLE